MNSRERYRRAFRAAIDAFKTSKANRELQQESASATAQPSEYGDKPDGRTVSVRTETKSRSIVKMTPEAAIRNARRAVIRARFAACKAARADSVRQAHRAAVDASLGAVRSESNAVKASEETIKKADIFGKTLVGAYRSILVSHILDKKYEDVLSNLADAAHSTLLAAKRAAEYKEKAQLAAENASRDAKFAGACSVLATERAKHAADAAVEAAIESVVATYHHARLRAKKGPREERKKAREQMRSAGKVIQRISYNMSLNLADEGDKHLLRNIAVSRWTTRKAFGLFRFSKFLVEGVFLAIGFAVRVVRTNRFARQESNAHNLARKDAVAKQPRPETEESWPSLASATLAESAFRFGAFDTLIDQVAFAANEEAEAAQYKRNKAEECANTAKLNATLARDMAEFVQYCAVRAELLEARCSLGAGERVIAPAALQLPGGWARALDEDSIPARTWILFHRAQDSAGTELQRAKWVVDRHYREAEATNYASRPEYEIDRHLSWTKKLGKESVSMDARSRFLEASRAIQCADYAGCSYYAACIISFLSRAGALADNAASAESQSDLNSSLQDALRMCEIALNYSDWAAEEAEEYQQKLSVDYVSIGDYAAARAAGLPAGYLALAEYAKKAKTRTEFVKEAFERVIGAKNPNSHFAEARVRAKETAELAHRAAALEHRARLETLSCLVAHHKNGILDSRASLRTKKNALLDRLKGYTDVAKRAEIEGIKIFKAIGQDYRIRKGLSDEAERISNLAAERWAERQESSFYYLPWKEEHPNSSLPYEMASVLKSCKARKLEQSTARKEENGKGSQGDGNNAIIRYGELENELEELEELIKCIEEIYKTVDFLADTQGLAKSARFWARGASKYASEARNQNA